MLQRLFFLVLFFCFCSTSFNVYAQKFKYKKIENTFSNFIEKDSSMEYVKIIDYLPKNYVEDASVDYTIYIQKAIEENNNVEFPNFPLLINVQGIQLKSNSNIFFNKKSVLHLKPSDNSKYHMFLIQKAENINIYNLRLIGDRNYNVNRKGEWGMGVGIYNAQNINIYNIDVRDMWGDAIYITSYGNSKNSTKDVEVKYGVIDNVRRNGISLISGSNITIQNLLISNTNGTNPASGIDIEPNTNTTSIINHILLKNIKTYNNHKDGIVLNLKNLIQSNYHNEVNIKIDTHQDYYSRHPLNILLQKNSGMSLRGGIIIENVTYKNSRELNVIKLPENKFARRLPTIELNNVKSDKMNLIEIQTYFNNSFANKNKFKINKD